jgi:putative endonuclease
MLQCADGTLYTGITTDLERRVDEHNTKRTGARYTRARRPVTCVHSEVLETRSAALKRELEIKKLSRTEKLKLFENANR